MWQHISTAGSVAGAAENSTNAKQLWQCMWSPPKYDSWAYIMLTLLTVLFAMPLQIGLDLIVDNTLLAPTMEDVSRQADRECEELGASVGGGVAGYVRRASIGVRKASMEMRRVSVQAVAEVGSVVRRTAQRLSMAIELTADISESRRRTMRISTNTTSRLSLKRSTLIQRQMQSTTVISNSSSDNNSMSVSNNNTDNINGNNSKNKIQKKELLLRALVAYRESIRDERERRSFEEWWGLVRRDTHFMHTLNHQGNAHVDTFLIALFSSCLAYFQIKFSIFWLMLCRSQHWQKSCGKWVWRQWR
jgi:hypothetical protein